MKLNFNLSLIFSFWIITQCPSSLFSFSNDPESYLKDKIPVGNERYATMKVALELLDHLQPKILVETGTARCGNKNYGTVEFIGDGGSTIIFGEWAKKNNSLFYSVDISQSAIDNAGDALGNNDHVRLICSDSIQFLANFGQSIDFLYLDSYDFQAANPLPSQTHHLKEIIAAYPYLKTGTIVMIDDCDLPKGGKGALVIPYLLKKGWTIYSQGYQVIMINKSQ